MSARVAIIAALPREVASLIRGFTEHKDQVPLGIYVWSSPTAVVVAAGMGAERVTLGVEAAIKLGPISQLVSIGLAGACDPSVGVGSVLEMAQVIDVRTGERFATSAGQATAILATGVAIASLKEKARLFASYQAAAVDMEAATVARLAAGHEISFRAIKGISDDATFELEALSRFTTRLGHFNVAGFALYTALRPHTWGPAMQLGKHSGVALTALTETLRRDFQLN